MTYSRHSKLALIILAIAVSMVRLACACDVPVFRYALERWQSDPYELLVYHDADLTREETLAIAYLRSEGDIRRALTVQEIDMRRDVPDRATAIWGLEQDKTLPRMILRSPSGARWPATLWSGAITRTNADLLLESPLRRELAKRLLEGDSAVWILVRCGDTEKDDAALALLQSELPRLQEELQLSDMTDDETVADIETSSHVTIRKSFSVLVTGRDDEREKLLVSAILQTEPDLKSFNEPVAIPVFGRARAFHALVGKGINTSNIRNLCSFILGPCSCKVKTDNAGTDLPVMLAWDDHVFPTADTASKPLPPLELIGIGPEQPSYKSALPLVAHESTPDNTHALSLKWTIAILFISVVVVMIIASFVVVRKHDRRA